MIEVYQTHIELLSKELKCEIRQSENLPGMMYVEFSYVEGPIIKNQIHYLTMLHELGHFACGHTQGRPPKSNERFYFDNGVLKSEAQAWEWALDRCKDEIENKSRRFMWDTCLGSYYMHYRMLNGTKSTLTNGDRHHIPFVYDRPDEYFSSIVKRIQGDLKNYNIQYLGRK